jgi:hypothetical protein
VNDPLTRRFFLKGIGGATLALPMLPSLLTPSEARAQTAQNRKRYMHFFTEHGGLFGANVFPADSTLTAQQTYAGFPIRRGALAPTTASGVTTLSPLLSASSSVLTAGLVGKMNVLRGLDIPFGIAHYHGGTLGNYASNNGDNPTSAAMQANKRPTIDQVMANSSGFYTSLTGISQRTAVVVDPTQGEYQQLCCNYANPTARSGAIQPVTGTVDSLTLFDQFFPAGGMTTMAAPRPPIIDRVRDNYLRLRNGNRRLSTADKARLDDYIARIDDLERRVTAMPSTVACTAPLRPAQSNEDFRSATANYDITPSAHVKYYQLLVEVVVAALQCGLTRIAAMHLQSYWHSFSTVTGSSWHEDIAHQTPFATTGPQATMLAAKQLFFEQVLLYLVSKLDAIDDGDGKTLLDRTLVTWMDEHGNLVHQTQSIPVVTFGSADGALRTGNYCDYRNLSAVISPNTDYEGTIESGNKRFGLTLNQWFGNILQVMGVPRSEYQEADHNGYGVRPTTGGLGDCCNAGYTPTNSYPDAVWTVAGDMLPWLAP